MTVHEENAPIITNPEKGFIGIDLNYHHLSVSEIDKNGELLQSFNIKFNEQNTNIKVNSKHLNKTIGQTCTPKDKIPSHKMKNILGNALTIITELSLKTGKPIVIEQLDFAAKKRQLKLNKQYTNNNGFNYSDMLSSFAYSKFKEILTGQANRKGLEIIEVNPVYTSLIGLVNYVKPMGLSVHMAASYVIARRGQSNKTNDKESNVSQYFKSKKYEIKEKPILNKDNQIEILYKSKVCQLPSIVNNKAAEDKLTRKTKNSVNRQNLSDCDITWSDISKRYSEFRKAHYTVKLQRFRYHSTSGRGKKLESSYEVGLKIDTNLSNYTDLFVEDFQNNSIPNIMGIQ